VAVSVLTLVVVLLLMRVVDDLRDLDYDRVHNPDRPLASGAVRVRDLHALLIAGTALVLALNAWRWPVLCVLAVQLTYAYAVLGVDRRWGWPSGDALVLSFLVSFPVQLLVGAFLYAGLLDATGLAPSWRGAVGIAVAGLAFLHLELARKLTREPAPGERTYVTLLGVRGTQAGAIGCAVASVVLLLAVARGSAVSWLVVLPLACVALGLRRFHRPGTTAWPYGLAALFLLGSFTTWQVVALIERWV
jgi:4-hydroxybenzoate polyprenyltransferase